VIAVKEGMAMKSDIKAIKVKKRTFWDEVRGQLLILIGQLFFGIVLTGMVFYLVAQYKMGSFQPFELATTAGLLGGFPLLAAFGGKVDDERLTKRLKAIGGLYLLAAILFVVFAFYQAADQAKIISQTGAGVWMFKVIYVATFYGAAVALTLGMWMTLEMVPMLMELGSFKDRIKKIFRMRKQVVNSGDSL
jgi:hypothetical protein